MTPFRPLLPLAALVLAALPSAARPACDTAIRHARVLDVRSGRVREHATILLRDGRIAGVLDDRAAARRAATRTIDAAGRLVTPGLVDAHFHAGEILPDSLSMAPDSIRAYRRILADAYLPWGVTAVRSCGDAEAWMTMLREWMTRAPGAPDFFACGAALASPNDRRYRGHVAVDGATEARAKVRQYHDAGFRNLKVYWRLREPEFGPAVDEANRLGMRVTGHVDYRLLGIHRALELGLRQFEHAYTFGVDAIDSAGFEYDNGQVFVDHYAECFRGDTMPGSFFVSRIEMFNTLGPGSPALRAIVADLRAHGARVTPTLHVFAQRFGLTWFHTPGRRAGYDDTDALPDSALARCRAGYRVLAALVKDLHDAGVPLAVGSDWADPGRACLSEMLLLHDCGIPMADVFTMATLNGARAIGDERESGTIERGRRANLVIFDADPLADPRNLLGGKLVLKDGVTAFARD